MNSTMRMLGRYPHLRDMFLENMRLREEGGTHVTHGPAAQFKWTLKKCGAWNFDAQNLCLRSTSGEEVPVLSHDSELLAHEVREALRAGKWGEAAQRRPQDMQGLEEGVDKETSSAFLASLKLPSERKLMQAVLSGAIRTRDRAHRRGQAERSTCPWCTGRVETLEHMLYECRAWEEHRPPELVAAFQAQPHCAPCSRMCGLIVESPCVRQASGMISAQRIPPIQPELSQRLASGEGSQQEGLSGDGRVIIYTDGSNKGGVRSRLRQGGIGAFWGAGHFANFSLPLGGRSQTNQRAELQAFLRAASTDPRRILIKTDSQYVVGGVRRLPAWQEAGWQGPNWDLWQQVRALLMVDPSRVEVQWVKGHATMADVRWGVTSWEDRMGNRCADHLANVGADMALQACPGLAEATAIQQARGDFAKKHHAMLLAIAKEQREAVQELAWLYYKSVPEPFAPPRRPGSFARRALNRRAQ